MYKCTLTLHTTHYTTHTMTQTQTEAAVDEMREFLDRYYAADIRELRMSDQRVLPVDYGDLFAYDADRAEQLTRSNHPTDVLDALSEALNRTDAAGDDDLSNVTVPVVNLDDPDVHQPTELRHDHGGSYVGVRARLDRVTFPRDTPTQLAYECERCGIVTQLPVEGGEVPEPHECRGCERQGPFRVDHGSSEWTDICEFRLDVPPSDRDDSGAVALEGVARGPVVDYTPDGLPGHAGEEVIVHGILRREIDDEERAIFSRYFDLRGVEFPTDDDSAVNVDEHKDEFTELAGRDDAVDVFAESIAPDLHATDEWRAAFQLGVAYLFGAPRVDVDGGPTYRGDIHALIMSDFGMGKSSFTSSLADFSPHAIRKSATALSSGVGLTAAAVKDDFGGGDQWAIEPGLLVKADGGHLILDEIDKGPDELSQMNDAIEGEQLVDVEKAGQSRTFKSRTGVLATGNPVDGRFKPKVPISEQLDVDGSTLSRFDGIITMEDSPDTDEDRSVSETITAGMQEAMQAQEGDREEFDVLDRVVSPDVGRAWVAYARENVTPMLPDRLHEQISDWYAEEARQLNHRFDSGADDGDDMPVPVTARVVESTVRFAVAFARCHLRDTVAEQDVERAKTLSKRMIEQTWVGPEEGFDPSVNRGSTTQSERKQSVLAAISGEPLTPAEISVSTGLEEATVRDELETLTNQGEAIEPEVGVFRAI